MELPPITKKAARPLARLFTKAVNRAVGARIVALEDAHGQTWGDVERMKTVNDALERRLVALEETGRGSADHELTGRMDEIERRMEFVRRELMFEFRYGQRTRGVGTTEYEGDKEYSAPAVSVAPRVLNEAKLRSFGDDIRLNLGAGHIPLEGYLNVDSRELDGIDVLADIRSLPFGAGQVSTIFSAHLLEHFPVEEVRRCVLPYWHSLLKPGGRVVAVVPDADAMLDAYASGEMSFADLREVTFGGQEYDGDFHFNMYSKESIRGLLADAGFADATVTVSARRNGLCYEMQAEARRPDDIAPAE